MSKTTQDEALRLARWLLADSDIPADRAVSVSLGRLEEEINALRADAERYRLLRRGQHWSVIDWKGDVLRGDELDATIDTRLAAQAAAKGAP